MLGSCRQALHSTVTESLFVYIHFPGRYTDPVHIVTILGYPYWGSALALGGGMHNKGNWKPQIFYPVLISLDFHWEMLEKHNLYFNSKLYISNSIQSRIKSETLWCLRVCVSIYLFADYLLLYSFHSGKDLLLLLIYCVCDSCLDSTHCTIPQRLSKVLTIVFATEANKLQR